MRSVRTGSTRLLFRLPGFAATVLLFGLFGFLTGGWEVLLASLRSTLSVSTGLFGAALTIGFLGAPPAMVLAGRLADRFGARALVGASGVAMALAVCSFSVVDGLWLLVPVLVVYYGSNSAYDVGINAAGIAVEQTSERQVMTYFHAAYSGFGALGAVVSGALLAGGVGFRMVYVGLGFVLLVGVALFLWVRSLPRPSTTTTSTEAGGDGRSLFRNSTLLLVAGIVLLAYFAEGTIENWATIYLQTWLTFPVVIGASGVALFHTAMMVGRLGGARFIPVLGRRRTLLFVGVCGALGMAVALATTTPAIILFGLFVVGLSMSVVSPVGYSIAGDVAPERSGEASSVISTIGWSSFVVSPGLIGGLSELVGLRGALATVVLTSALVTVLAARLSKRF